MAPRTIQALFALLPLMSLSLAGSAHADEPAPAADEDSPLLFPEKRIYGVGLRTRYVGMPKGVIELFVEEAPSGAGSTGFGLDFVTRKGDVEFSVGFEYDPIDPDDGYYVENGGDPQTFGTTDFVEFENLSWMTLDAVLVYHTSLHKNVSLRYGGGFGFGYVSGDVLKTDALCSGPNAQTDCMEIMGGEEFDTKQDFFRFPPVINLLAGAQYTPMKNLAINVDLGMRTLLYMGVGAQYFF